MQVNQYIFQATEVTILDRFGFDQQDNLTLAWQTKKIDLPTLVDSMVVLFPELMENIYNSDGALPTGITRTFDLDTGNLKILNGKLYLNTTGFTGGLFQMELVSSGNGLIISSSGTGIQVSGSTGTCMSLAGTGVGLLSSAPRNVIQTSGSIPATVASSVLDVNSTTQGSRPVPRMTETERDVIASPADYLEVINTTMGMRNFYHPVFGWVTSPLNMAMACATTATVSATTYYFSAAAGLALRTGIGGLAVRPTRKGKIIGASFTRFIAGTLGDRSYSLYVRINDTTDYLIATQATTATETFFANSAINTTGVPVNTTDSIVMKLVVSGGAVDSANVLFFGNLLLV